MPSNRGRFAKRRPRATRGGGGGGVQRAMCRLCAVCAAVCCAVLLVALYATLWSRLPAVNAAQSGFVDASGDSERQLSTVRSMREAAAARVAVETVEEAKRAPDRPPAWTEDGMEKLYVDLYAKPGCVGSDVVRFTARAGAKLCARCFDACQSAFPSGASMLNDVRSLRVGAAPRDGAVALAPWTVSAYAKCVGKYTYTPAEVVEARIFSGLNVQSGCVAVPENAAINAFVFEGLPHPRAEAAGAGGAAGRGAASEYEVAAPQAFDAKQAAYEAAPPVFRAVSSTTLEALCFDGEMAAYAGGNVHRLSNILYRGGETEAEWCAARPGELAIAQLNVHDGVPSTVRYERIVEWIRLTRPDVVGLNELNNWGLARMEQLGKDAGLPHALFYAAKGKSGYSLGLLSRWPLRLVREVSAQFCHGVLHATLAMPGCAAEGEVATATRARDVHVVLTHLTPHGVGPNIAEARSLLAHVAASVPAGEAAFVMGDFNSLSPLDAPAYAAGRTIDALVGADKRSGENALKKKFVEIGVRAEAAEARSLSFAAHALLLAGGLVDVWAATAPVGGKAAGAGAKRAWQSSVPTALHVDAMHATAMRLDYIYANGALVAATSHRSAAIFTDRYSATLSDHFPSLAIVCFGETTSQSRCSAGGAIGVQRHLVADWKRLNLGCHWKLGATRSWAQYEQKRWKIAKEKRGEWRAEERGFDPVVAPRGTSCNMACAASAARAAIGAPAAGAPTFPPLPVGIDAPPFIVFPARATKACDLNAIRVLDTCDRLEYFFPCLLGCYHSAAQAGMEHPAFEAIDDQSGAGRCLLHEASPRSEEKSGAAASGAADAPRSAAPPMPFDCNAKHPRTQRMCGCTVREPERVWLLPGQRGESCAAACARARGECDHSALHAANNCAALRSVFPCADDGACLDSDGSDQPAFVVDATSASAGKCLFTTGASVQRCDASHPATQRLCPCRSPRGFSGVASASVVGNDAAQSFVRAMERARVKNLRGKIEAPPVALMWKYQDLKGKTQGPFSQSRMREWHLQDYFARDLLVMPIPPGIGFLPVGSFFPDWTRAFEAVT